MSGGKRTNCKECYSQLRDGTCVKCGWRYDKEFSGQSTLEKEKDIKK